MKRFYYYISLAVLLLLSCSKEQQKIDTVHFSIGADATKSIGDASAATQLLVGLFDNAGNALDYNLVVNKTGAP